MMSLSGSIAHVALALGAIVFAEVVRDFFHVAGHYWAPLQSGHMLHHKAYRTDLSVVSPEAYREAQWRNDVPEATVMVLATALLAIAAGGMPSVSAALAVGSLYSALFLASAVARSRGWLTSTDLTHKPGPLVELPSQWTVNRTYHWRHHFDAGNAYYSGTFALVDMLLGTCLSLKGKTVAVTGASGTLGRALIAELTRQGAKVVAFTTSTGLQSEDFGAERAVEVVPWTLGQEDALRDRLAKVDILILNHGINVYGDRTPAAICTSYEVNTWSVVRWMDAFLATVTESKHKALKEVWVNTSEAEVSPAFSPLYELSKRALGDLVTLRRLDAPCTVRKLVLGPFKSKLNPYGVMSAQWVARAIFALAKRGARNIIVTVNPLTYLAFPVKETLQSLYFRCFSRQSTSPTPEQHPPTQGV